MNSIEIIILKNNPKIIKEKIWCFPILYFKVKMHKIEDEIVVSEHNLIVEVADNLAIFGMKL